MVDGRQDTGSNRLHRELATAMVAFQELLARSVEMTAAERKCAGLLAERGSMTPGALAAETGLTTGAITGIVDRLVRAGFARREANPRDRRSVIVHAVAGDELARKTAPPLAALTAAMDAIDARYSPDERALIHRHLSDVIAVLHDQIAALGQRG